MRLAGFGKALGIGALLALALLWAPGRAPAQAFFGLDETLRGDSGVELAYGHTTDHGGDGVNAANDTAADIITRHGSARLAYKALIVGAQGSWLRSHQISGGVDQTEEGRRAASYLALGYEGLLTKQNDELLIEVNTSQGHDRFAYNGYLRQLDSLVPHETGLMYRLGFLALGYAQGDERQQLRVTDPSGPSFTQERFEYSYRARLAGLFFGDPAKVSLTLVAARKDTPAVPGTVISKEPGFEELKRVELRLFTVAIGAKQTHVLSAFTGDASSDVIERTASLSLSVSKYLTVGLSQTLITSQRGLLLLGTPTTSRSRHTADQIQIKLAF